MRALFIPFDWIASERMFGILPAWQQTQFQIAGGHCLVSTSSGRPESSKAGVTAGETALQVSGASGRVGAADGDNIAAAQTPSTQQQHNTGIMRPVSEHHQPTQ